MARLTKRQTDELEMLVNTLIDRKCVDLHILTAFDRLLRCSLYDIHWLWVRWSFYMLGVFNGDEVKYNEWGRANCEQV